MRQLKRILVGHDPAAGGEMALKSAAVLADRCGAALRLVHVVEPLDAYQRASHPLTALVYCGGERRENRSKSEGLSGTT